MFVLLLLFAAQPPLVESVEVRVQKLDAEIGALDPKLRFLTSEYVKPAMYEEHADVEKRISDGEVLSLLGDHVRAGIVLYDVISKPENETHPLYDRALFYLAESEFQTRNYHAARTDFQKLIERHKKDYLFEAFGRLVEIADVLQDYSRVEEEVSAMRSAGAGTLRPDVAYHYGKSLARRGQSALAIVQLEVVPADHKFHARARYIIAVENVRQGKLEAAIPYFKEALGAKTPLGPGADAEEVARFVELTWLALGRVYGELGKSGEALDAYQNIGSKSLHFDEMLYEVAWNYIRRSSAAKLPGDKRLNLTKASQALDLLLLSETEQQLQPEARLLKGNVLLRLGAAEEAGSQFAFVVNRYGPVKKELDRTDREQKEPVKYFDQLIAKNQGVFNAAAFLPPLAVSFASGEREVGQALGIANDLETGHKSVDDTRAIGDKLLAALETEKAMQFYPRLQEGYSRAIEIDSQIVVFMERAIALAREALTNVVTPEQQQELIRLHDQRAAAASRYRTLPQSLDQIESRHADHAQLIQDLMTKAYRLRFEVQGAHAQLVAAKKYADDSERSNLWPRARAEVIRRELQDELDALAVLEKEEHDLEGEVDREKARYAVSEDPQGTEDAARTSYEQRVREELSGVLQIAVLVGQSQSPAVIRLDAARARMLADQQTLRVFRDQIGEIVKRKAGTMREQIKTQEALLGDYERELQMCDTDARSLVGDVAYRTFETVRGKFRELMLKADVGVIDVAWAKKDSQTTAINRLVKEQKERLEAIDRDFTEVQHEDDGS